MPKRLFAHTSLLSGGSAPSALRARCALVAAGVWIPDEGRARASAVGGDCAKGNAVWNHKLVAIIWGYLFEGG